MDDIMAVYRLHSGSMWSSVSRLIWLEECSQMLKTLDKRLGYEYTNTIRQTLCSFYLETASIARKEGKRMGTARHLINCIRYGELHPGISLRTFTGFAS
jgi:hypothetical protein